MTDDSDQRPVNPFAPAQPVRPVAQPSHPAAPANPFAQAPATAPPVNPFAQAPATAAPVNPFAQAAVADAPYRAPVATPPLQVATPPVVQPLGAVPAITNLRPLTILVGLAAALFAVALMMQLLWMLSLPSKDTSITLEQLRDIGSAKKRAERTTIVALFALAGTVTPWLYLAGRNARRMCADRPRFAAWVSTVMFPIPAVNLVIIGLALNDIWRHSAERLRDRSMLITWFTRFMVYGAAARFAVIFLADTRHPLVLTNGIVATTTGESMSLVYVAGHSVLIASILTTMMMVALPVLGVIAVFDIDRAQREASLRLRAKAI